MPTDTKRDVPDFVNVYQRFRNLDSGYQAIMRRVAEPCDLRDTPALYRLYPGERPHDGWVRVAFFLPWCGHTDFSANFGAQLAQFGVRESRIFQVARAGSPLDLIQLRRLAVQIKANVDWRRFGWMLLKSNTDGSWSSESKRQFVEDYFITLTRPMKKRA